MVQQLMKAGMGKNTPRISVIINFLNEERFLQEAIESVFAQSFGDWELLLVDDGSTDGSMGIARRFAEMNPEKVRYLDHEGHRNRGMSASRNLGVRIARGEYIAYLDGDDMWMPDKLEKQVAILESHPEAAMVCGPLLEWHSWDPNREGAGRDRIYGAGPTGHHPFADTVVDPPNLLSLFLRDERFIPAGALIRRHAIERVGGAEEEFRDSYQDAVFFVKLCRTEKAVVSGALGYKYRIHPNSCTRRQMQFRKERMNEMRYLRWIEEYFLKQGVHDENLWRILGKSMFLARHPALQAFFDAKHAKYLVKLLARQIFSEKWRKSFQGLAVSKGG